MKVKNLIDKENPVVVTANHLKQGYVVYLSKHKSKEEKWTRQIEDAHAFFDGEIANQALNDAMKEEDTIVGVYLLKVNIVQDEGEGGYRVMTPDHPRESLRALGPKPYIFPTRL